MWQSIETAPINKTIGVQSEPFLIWDGASIAVAHSVRYNHTGRICFWIDNSYGFNEDGEIMGATHWMPLPEPPK